MRSVRRLAGWPAPARPRVALVLVALVLVALGLVWGRSKIAAPGTALGGGFDRESSVRSHRGSGRTTASGLDYALGPYGSILGYEVGDTFSEGLSEVLFKGDKPITLLGVRQRITQDDILEPIGAAVSMPDRPYGLVQEFADFPPRNTPDLTLGTVRRLKGTVIEPGRAAARVGIDVFLGYRVTGLGRAVRPGFELDYEVDGKRYTVEIPNHLAVCVPKRKDCPPAPCEVCNFE